MKLRWVEIDEDDSVVSVGPYAKGDGGIAWYKLQMLDDGTHEWVDVPVVE